MVSKSRKIGDLGEDIACKFLKNKGFSILGRNYLKKWGEIDIIARKAREIHFVEVKSVTRENIIGFSDGKEGYRPEDNLHPKKLKRLSRAVETYCAEKGIVEDWHIDAVIVQMDPVNKKAYIKLLENINHL